MHDGIELEKRGIPAAVIVTREFVVPARAIAEMRGMPCYPFVVVDHPIGSLEEAGLLERARMALPQVLEILSRRQPSGREGY
ncbi:MAG: hypothetical protein IH860_02870 [Chloroflexi bacterium]|nr:hypothetical protein [Chloroflexota bacterium]